MCLQISILVCMALLAACSTYPSVSERPSNWARESEIEGVGNFYEVSENLYRSERPTAGAIPEMERLGIKTILSLQSFHSNDDLLENSSIKNEQLTVKAWHPEEKELKHFLNLVTDPVHQPLLVHCYHGSDRTGAMCAAYRIVVQGWSKEDAIAEMKYGGFGFHRVWGNLPEWIRNLNVTLLRADLPRELP
jgi:protein tyrosine/serine phosphatase